MLRAAACLFLLILAAGPASAETEDEIRALGRALHDADLDKADAAAKSLQGLGAKAAPALTDLVAALDRTLPAGIADLHWHPWMGLLPLFRRRIVGTLHAIGPKAKAAIPGIARMLERGYGGPADWLVAPLFHHWRAEPDAKAALLRWAAHPRLRIDPALKTRFKEWLVSLGEEALPTWDAWLAARRGPTTLALHALQESGEDGMAILRKHFEAHDGHRTGMLTMWINAGALPLFSQREAVKRLGLGMFRYHRVKLATLLARLDTDYAPLLAKHLGPLKFHHPAWPAVTQTSGAFGRRVGKHWFAAHRPSATDTGFGIDGRRRTQALGGVGGSAFAEAPGGFLVALRWTSALVNWRPAIRSIQGLYWHKGKMVEGAVHGHAGTKRGEVHSHPGYAIGGIYAQHHDRLGGFAVLYMRIKGDRLDPTDAYINTWHGGAIPGGVETLLGGQGHAIVGLHGRSGADIDALGLIEQRPPPTKSAPKKP